MQASGKGLLLAEDKPPNRREMSYAMPSNIDDKTAFRRALGSFATGVTIVTTLDADGDPVGVTASSFNSVSLDPPLVLWSLARASLSRDAFIDSGHFAIHILTAAQQDLSNLFAKSGADKFGGLDWAPGALKSPILTEHAAVFECKTRHQYDGGDHIIMVGEVTAFEARDEAPLLFHDGQYAERRMQPATLTDDGSLASLLQGATQALDGTGIEADALEHALADRLTLDQLADAKLALRQIIDRFED